MQNKLRVAICIPTYEKKELLERALKSIDKQSYKDYFVVITDNSETDDVENFINSYISENKNYELIYIHNERQLGASGNTNKSIDIAVKNGAKLIKILHEDDWFTDENALQKFVDCFVNDNNDIVFSANYEVYADGITKHVCQEKELQRIIKEHTYLFRANPLGAPSNMMFRINEQRFDSEYTWLLDVDFYIRILKNSNLKYINEPLISIGHDGEQLTNYFSRNPFDVLKELFKLYNKYDFLQNIQNRLFLVSKTIEITWIIIKQHIRKILNRMQKN